MKLLSTACTSSPKVAHALYIRICLFMTASFNAIIDYSITWIALALMYATCINDYPLIFICIQNMVVAAFSGVSTTLYIKTHNEMALHHYLLVDFCSLCQHFLFMLLFL